MIDLLQENKILNSKKEECNFVYSNVLSATQRLFRTPKEKLIITISRIPLINSVAHSANAKIRSAMAKISSDNSSGKRAYPEIKDKHINTDSLNLQVGEWVQIRSKEEIFSTLNEEGKYKGLLFMAEMIRFCGKKFKVFKKVERIMLESTGELREIKSPTVFLEGVFCDGEFHNRCDRSCFLYWREIWLKKVPDSEAPKSLGFSSSRQITGIFTKEVRDL